MDKQTRDAEVRRARLAYQARTNKSLADLLTRLRDNPRSFTGTDREAILTTVASRLWRTPEGAHEDTPVIAMTQEDSQ